MKLNTRRTPNVPAVLGELDAQQLRFLEEFIALGGRPQDGANAALLAGYGDGNLERARRCANTLLAAPKITKALRQAIGQRFNVAVGAAFNTLLEIAVNPKAPANARISAAQEILNRSEIGPIVSRAAVVKSEFCIEDLIEIAHAQREEEEAKRKAAGSGPQVIDVTPRRDGDSE